MNGSKLTLGALSGPETFNGGAAKLMLDRGSEFGRIVYFPTSEETIEAVVSGKVDAACVQEQTSSGGFHAGTQARMSEPGSSLHVIAEASRGYECSLLGKPGARMDSVRLVLGHTGSTASCRRWLEATLPRARIETVDTSSRGAAQSVLDGDGSIASVGNQDVSREYGLTEMAKRIDDGRIVNYWAVSLQPRYSETPTRVVVAARFGGDTAMSELISAIAQSGFTLQSVYPRANGGGLYEYDYVLRFRGAGCLDAVRAVVMRFRVARLAGAWEARE